LSLSFSTARAPWRRSGVFAASAENAREYALGRRTRSVYCEQQKRAAGDRFADLLSQEPKSNKPSKRELKKGIVDDINL